MTFSKPPNKRPKPSRKPKNLLREPAPLPSDVEVIMAIRVVRFGTPRAPDEGIRIGTVRRPPRGVPKSKFASRNWYDIWFPNLAPSVPTMKLGLAANTPAQWAAFAKKYRAEMSSPENRRTIELLAKLSRQTNFPIGCYCENEAHCHRSILRKLLIENGAKIARAE